MIAGPALAIPGLDAAPAEHPVRLAADAMGTRFEALLFGGDPVRLRAAGEAALDVIHDWDRRLSWFSPGSFLSHVNARAAAGPVAVDREFYELLRLCRGVWEDSNGAFDVTIAPLMKAWGFRGPGVESPDRIEAVRRAVGMEKVSLGHTADTAHHTIAFLVPGVSLDLGSVAKGAALDAAAAVLRDCGVRSALLHGGTSSVVAIGCPPGLDGWPVAVETGRPDRPVFALRDTCLSVSAPRGRTVATSRGPVGHIIDPRTGTPAERTGTAATIHPSGALCDAWSTALLVLGFCPRTLPGGMSVHLDPHTLCETAS